MLNSNNQLYSKPDTKPNITIDINNIDEQSVKQLIGKDGYYFKLTTKNCQLEFVWYNKENKKLRFGVIMINALKHQTYFLIELINLLNQALLLIQIYHNFKIKC